MADACSEMDRGAEKYPLLGFGQAVIGPPGSGKSTYVRAMQALLARMGRKSAIINLDPAGEDEPGAAVSLRELLGLEEVMSELRLGPNGSLLYCMEYLQENLDWLRARLQGLRGTYLLLDCPGQVELYTHHPALPDILRRLGGWGLRLCAVHLVDSHYCTDPAKFISVLCTSLSTMLHVELPHINVLSKMDLIEQYGRLAFNLDYYTEVMDLSFLVEQLTSDPFFRRHKRLHEKLAGVIEDYGLVTFMPLSIKDDKSLQLVLSAVDKASGFCFGEAKQSLGNLMSVAVGADFQFTSTLAFQEKYVENDGRTVEEETLDL
ncbi:GPN-loop GTPase 2 [Xenopus laevis]|uniref:GPN-loop GTPase 2 n=1 Tax=Xenopus laevis TaxID=8355 RepID=GPN2_XENLA|nr:GPN-loop GTPase 2 [Xenopus laevis]Q66KF6.1 RecName: Full=GPN-loop GTPase 2; AltName: Full=ATP-binding domain 1 family member B [Xenopus laevis]AAH80422.1 LOC398460 protein [Xenopus laevis]